MSFPKVGKPELRRASDAYHQINFQYKKAEIRSLSKVDSPTDFKDLCPISLLYHLS